MPRGDGTGPYGTGPVGRGMGYAGAGRPGVRRGFCRWPGGGYGFRVLDAQDPAGLDRSWLEAQFQGLTDRVRALEQRLLGQSRKEEE